MDTATPAANTPSGGQGTLLSSRWLEPGGRWREREASVARVRETPAAVRFGKLFPRWRGALEHLSSRALSLLEWGEPVDPNDPDCWADRLAHAESVLRRHGISAIDPLSLTIEARTRLIEGQAKADGEAGIDWSAPDLELASAACETLPVDLDDPRAWDSMLDRRRALARRLELEDARADDLSRFALACPEQFDQGDLRCWRIASRTWLDLADRRLEEVERVERPVGVFLCPAAGREGWQLAPVLSVEMMRLVDELGGRLDRDMRSAVIPATAASDLVGRVNVRCLHHGPKQLLESAGTLATEVSRELGATVPAQVIADKLERWGRLGVHRRAHRRRNGQEHAEIELRVVTFGVRDLPRARFGSAAAGEHFGQPSAAQDLGEAVQAATERGIPLVLSTEAAGKIKDMVRVGRMKGRPGMLSLTTADELQASTRTLTAERAVGELRKLKVRGAKVTLDAGARQILRMTLAKPLDDDPVLVGRQREIGALKVVGSGVDASQVGSGKTISSGRAICHRAIQPRFRGLVVAEGRLLGQWRAELAVGAPGRGMPALAPNVDVLRLDEHQPIAGQLGAFDRELGDRAGLALCSNSLLDRYPNELCQLRWHLLVADEALRYSNPATRAHQALAAVRFQAVADCWLLTATPRSKSAEQLDVLVGLAIGDRAMISERLNTREAGDLMDETNAHRLRVNYGPHLVRVTRRDMQAWMPKVMPARPLAIDPDGALADLLEAIRTGGREAYRRLLEVLAQLKALEHGTELHRQALAELSRAQGVVLGNVGVFVAASVDPEALTHSKAALAQALCRQGLVQAAVRGGGDGLPSLRGIVAQTIAGVAADEQVLVFSERVWPLRHLAAALRDRRGVDAQVADGSISQEEFEDLKARFTAGGFPVLCLSPIGAEGHNLQNASVIVNLDLPWTPDGLEQRVGRAARPGARGNAVHTFIPYVRGGGVEHIVSVLAPRGAEHHAILDSFDGVPANESTIASQLGEITGEVAAHKADSGFAATAARLRVAASVFGA
jgi:hypothetical protein